MEERNVDGRAEKGRTMRGHRSIRRIACGGSDGVQW